VGFVVVLHVMVFHVMVLFPVVGAIAPLLLKLLMAFMCLSTVFAVALDSIVEPILCRANAPFTSRAPFVPIIRANW
jgi:hypothetical protein